MFALLPAAAFGQEEATLTEMIVHNSPLPLVGICFYDGSMYVSHATNKLTRWDLETGESEVVAYPLVPDEPGVHLHGLTVGEVDTFWVVQAQAGQLFELRFSDYSVATVLTAPPSDDHYYGLAFRDGLLWAGHHSPEGTLTPIHVMDPQTGEFVGGYNFGVADVHGLAWVDDYLWVLDNFTNTLHKIDDDGEGQANYLLPDDWYGSLAYDGEHFWTHNLTSFFRIELPAACEGDANGDGTVDPLDAGYVLARFGCPAGEGHPACDAADVNGDGEVNPLDTGFILSRFGDCP